MTLKTHPLAQERNWVPGEDYPEWGNNTLYLQTIQSSYLQPDESPKDAYRRLAKTAAKHYGGKNEDKFFEIFWAGWLIPATPVMCNLGTKKGLPISCFAGKVDDHMYDIYRKNTELAMLSKIGGGTAYDFSSVRPIGSPIKGGLNGTSDGIIPFIKSYDSTCLATKQGQTRRGAVAIYLDIEHKEYDAFLRVREPKGDVNRQCHAIHQGSVISDSFMEEVLNKNGKAREVWKETLKTRVKTGEPYLFFIDNANKNLNPGFKENDLRVYHSNLCSEIMLPTDANHTLVCCLSSLNLHKYDEWKDTDTVYYSTLFLDAVLQEFIDGADDIKGIDDAIRFAKKSRAIGLGALGWHSYLQEKMIPFVSIQANALTTQVFSNIRQEAERATTDLAKEFGEPEWCKGTGRRNLTLLAIAPNRSSAKLAGGVSQGIEPIAANIYTDDDAKGMYVRRNPVLRKLLKERGINNDIWDRISEDRGSVLNQPDIPDDIKEVFKTFKEINQLELIRQAVTRQKYIDQGQSLNLAFHQDAPAKFINKCHIEAWKGGLKALYYLRSESVLRADSSQQRDLYSECVMCEG